MRSAPLHPVVLAIPADPERAVSVATRASALLEPRDAVVVVAWHPPKLSYSPFVAAWDTVFDVPEGLVAQSRRRACEAGAAAMRVLASAGWNARSTLVRHEGPAWRAGLETADALQASVFVIDEHSRGLLHSTSRPLLVLPAVKAAAKPPAPLVR